MLRRNLRHITSTSLRFQRQALPDSSRQFMTHDSCFIVLESFFVNDQRWCSLKNVHMKELVLMTFTYISPG